MIDRDAAVGDAVRVLEAHMHEGTFVFAAGGAPLTGPGTLDVTEAGLRVTAQVKPSRLITILSVAAGLASLLAVVVGVVVIDEVAHVGITSGSLKFPAILGLLGGAVGWAASAEILGRVLPTRSFDQVIAFAHLIPHGESDGTAQIQSTDPACGGRIAFHTPRAAALMTELEQRRRDRAQ